MIIEEAMEQGRWADETRGMYRDMVRQVLQDALGQATARRQVAVRQAIQEIALKLRLPLEDPA